MKSFALSFLCAALLVGAAMAKQKAEGHATHHPDGEVRKVDKEAGKMTLKHGEVKNLDCRP